MILRVIRYQTAFTKLLSLYRLEPSNNNNMSRPSHYNNNLECSIRMGSSPTLFSFRIIEPRHAKRFFRHMQTVKVQINLLIHKSDQGLLSQQTESLDTIECIKGDQMPGSDFTHTWMNLNMCILRMLEDTFSLRGPIEYCRMYQLKLTILITSCGCENKNKNYLHMFGCQ